MPSEPNTTVKPAPSQGWMRRVVVQQLDAVARLAAIARRLIGGAAVTVQPVSASSLSASLHSLEKVLRLQARVSWALRLIDGLRTRLLSDLQALDSGRPPAPPLEARSFADTSEPIATDAAAWSAQGIERGERPERPERFSERERFGFARRGDDELAEILKRPPAEIIALICRELGLPEDWPRLAEEAWARQEADGALAAYGEGLGPNPPIPRPAPPFPPPTTSPS